MTPRPRRSRQPIVRGPDCWAGSPPRCADPARPPPTRSYPPEITTRQLPRQGAETADSPARTWRTWLGRPRPRRPHAYRQVWRAPRRGAERPEANRAGTDRRIDVVMNRSSTVVSRIAATAMSMSAASMSRWVMARTVVGPSRDTSTLRSASAATQAVASSTSNTTMLVSTASRIDGEAIELRQPVGEPPSVVVILGEPVDVVAEGRKSSRCHHPGLSHGAAHHLLVAPCFCDRLLRADAGPGR